MVPLPVQTRHSSRLLYILLSAVTHHVPRLLHRAAVSESDANHVVQLARRTEKFDPHDTKSIVFVVLIPVLVLSSGLFAGLTLGYMSLDETQLNVLSISGTPEQKQYANKIKPIRKNGHLLLVTLLLANMIVNETLPVIADGVLGGGPQAVVISTVLIVIFAEIIPQSLFTRHGLYLGAKLAGLTRVLIYALAFIAWPVAKLLEFVLGPHHGIIYRRGELKELIAMHSNQATHGGDLQRDTVMIVGATLDLQEKVVRQAMTPIKDVFMLSIESKLDYALLKKICETGHSRVPVYEEIEVPLSVMADPNDAYTVTMSTKDREAKDTKEKPGTIRVKKIIGILLVKQCVLLDPKDATPLRQIPLNKVPFVPNNEPLLGILDKFQEGRSHMAIVSRFSVEKAASVKREVKQGLTERLRQRVGMGDTDSDTDSDDSDHQKKDSAPKKKWGSRRRGLMGRTMSKVSSRDIEEGTEDSDTVKDSNSQKGSHKDKDAEGQKAESEKDVRVKEEKEAVDADADVKGVEGKDESMTPAATVKKLAERKRTTTMAGLSVLEQSMPADAVLAKSGAAEFLQGFDPAVMPLGIITLEDVLEELIGEEIYDEFDDAGAHGDPYQVPPAPAIDVKASVGAGPGATPAASRPASVHHGHTTTPARFAQVPATLKGMFRTRSAPPVPRDEAPAAAQQVQDQTQKAAEATGTSTTTPSIQMPRPVKSTGRHPPSVILEQHSSVSSNEEGPNPILLTQRGRSEPGNPVISKDMLAPPALAIAPAASGPPSYPGSVQPYPVASLGSAPAPAGPVVTVSASQASSRDASPAPPLEAILLERKRRLAAALGSAGGSSPAAAASAVLGVPASAPATPGLLSVPGSVLHTPVATNPPGGAFGGVAVGGGGGGRSQSPGPIATGPVKVAHSAAKGTKFKSSPLSPVDKPSQAGSGAEIPKAKEGQAEVNSGDQKE